MIMSELDILCYPDQKLRTKAKPVSDIDDTVRTLIDDMLLTMHQERGIGLAATQVNVHQQVIVMDLSEAQNEPLHFINPKILEREGEMESQEGCLSIPHIFETIKRSRFVKVSALNKDGEPFEMEAEDLLAVCIQHEVEHLEGKLFIDKLSPLKRQLIRKKMAKQKKVPLL